VTQGPASPDPGRDDDPARRPGEPGGTPDEGEQELPPPIEDWLTDDEWLDWLSTVAPGYEDPENDPGQAARSVKPARGAKATRAPKGSRIPKESRASKAARVPKGTARVPKGKRRGPGQPGSARRVAGDSPGPVGAFAAGQVMDTAPGGPVVFGHAEHAAGDDARFAGAVSIT
jgi:hypothetical protein